MKNIYSLILALLISTALFSQNTSCDNIIYKNGEELSVQVVEISESIVKYKKCDNLDGPIYSEDISKVFMIKYKNGTKDILNQTEYVNKVEYKTANEVNITNSNATQELSPDWQTKHKIGLNIGYSSAIGLFGSYDEDDGDEDYGPGFAKGGFSYNLSYQYSFTENFAATFIWGGGANKFDAQSYANVLSDVEPNLNWSVEAEPYTMGCVLIGAKAMVGQKVKGYINPVIGTSSIIAPEVKIIATYGGASVTQKIRESDIYRSIIYGGSIGVDFQVSSLISLNLDLLVLAAKFKDVERDLETFDSNGNPMVTTIKGNQKYSTSNLTIGIGFNF